MHDQLNTSKMMLHAGGRYATYGEVEEAKVPEPDGAWYPIAHSTLVNEVRGHLESSGFRVTREQHALAKNDMRYFGLLDLVPANDDAGARSYCWSLGIRNSNDKAFSANVVAGTRVFVCDNLAFSAEIMFARKHTLNIGRDLPKLTSRVVGKVSEQFGLADERFAAYTAAGLDDKDAHHALIMAMRSGVVAPARLPAVLENWRKPPHEEFAPRNAWSLFNAFTEEHKRLTEPRGLITRSQALHGLFDGLFMLNRADVDLDAEVDDGVEIHGDLALAING